MSDLGIEERAPAIVGQIQVTAAQAAVVDVAVDHQARAVHNLPLGVATEVKLAGRERVGIGGVVHAIAGELHTGDAIVAEAIARHDVERDLGADEHIGQAQRVVACAAQLRVAIVARCRRLDDGGVEVVDTRAGDACGEGQLQAVCHVGLEAHACAGYPVAEVGAEVLLTAVGILAAEVAPLVTQPGAGRPLVQAVGVAGIGGSHLRQVVESRDGGVGTLGVVGKRGVAAVHAIDILQSRLDGVVLGKGACPVKLSRMLHKGLTAMVVGAGIVNGHVFGLQIAAFAVLLVARGREHIAQGERLALGAGLVLIVKAAVEVIVTAQGHIRHLAIAIQQIARGIGGAPVNITSTGVVIVESAERQRQQVERVNLQTRLDVAIVHIDLRVAFGVAQQLVPVVIDALLIAELLVGAAVAQLCAIVDACGPSSHLCSDVGVGAGRPRMVDASAHGARDASHLTVVIEHDVQDGAHALGIIFRARLGDDLDALDHACGDGLQHLLRIARDARVGVTILVNFKVRRTLHTDVVLGIDGDQWHLAQHLQHGAGFGVAVALHVVGQAVNLSLDERTDGFHLHLAQVLEDGIVKD